MKNVQICLIHSYSSYFLSIYQVLGPLDKALNETNTFPVMWGLYSGWEDM